MKRLFLYFVLPVSVLFGLIQLVPSKQTNPKVAADIKAPVAVKAQLRTSCYDCHSNETKWPWYSKVAPFSWLVVHDVNEGRSELNFSDWGTYNTFKKRYLLKEIKETVEEGTMPVNLYTYAHPKAKLSPATKSLLLKWVQTSLKNLPSPKRATKKTK